MQTRKQAKKVQNDEVSIDGTVNITQKRRREKIATKPKKTTKKTNTPDTTNTTNEAKNQTVTGQLSANSTHRLRLQRTVIYFAIF